MSFREWIPKRGDKKVRKKLRDLEHIKVGFPVLLSSSIMKIYESLVVGSFNQAWRWITAFFLIFLLYIYEDEVSKKAEEVKEKAEDTVQETVEDG